MARIPYLPSQQMIEHLLVRLIGARYLYRQTADFCSTAYVYPSEQTARGLLKHAYMPTTPFFNF